MNNNMISKEQLVGYRVPSMVEQKKIQQYMTMKLNKSKKLWNLLKNLCICFDAVFILGLFGVGGIHLAGEKIVMGGIVFLLTAFIFLLNKWKQDDRIFLNRLKEGAFQVLDCSVYEVDFVTDLVNDAVVYICTSNGQYCDERFVVDYISAKEWTQQKEISFLLMRAVRGKDMLYELFTEKKLERR